MVLVIATEYSLADRQTSVRGLYLTFLLRLFSPLSLPFFSVLRKSIGREGAPLTGLLKYLC